MVNFLFMEIGEWREWILFAATGQEENEPKKHYIIVMCMCPRNGHDSWIIWLHTLLAHTMWVSVIDWMATRWMNEYKNEFRVDFSFRWKFNFRAKRNEYIKCKFKRTKINRGHICGTNMPYQANSLQHLNVNTLVCSECYAYHVNCFICIFQPKCEWKRQIFCQKMKWRTITFKNNNNNNK